MNNKDLPLSLTDAAAGGAEDVNFTLGAILSRQTHVFVVVQAVLSNVLMY
ncbi:hypothetical protein [Pseudoalteromonas citrea]|nr:hypothetical protein [Pseudoalteromonas citrea]